MSLSGGLWYVGAFVVALGILVVFHELGHYLVARLCGVKVLRFSVGFGKVLWLRRFGPDQTEWTLSAIPLGGYVKMLDEREGEVAADELHRAFNRQPVGRRALIVAAGPVANLVLALLIYWVMFMVGVQEIRPLLHSPEAGTPAASAGLTARDLITAVNDQATPTWGDLRMDILEAVMAKAVVELEAQLIEHQGRRAAQFVGPLDACLGNCQLMLLQYPVGHPGLAAVGIHR